MIDEVLCAIESIMSSKAVRIVNLDDHISSNSLKQFIQQEVTLNGSIEYVHVRKDDNKLLTYAYVIFENSQDAENTVLKLNGFPRGLTRLDVALIGANLQYKQYYPYPRIPYPTLLQKEDLRPYEEDDLWPYEEERDFWQYDD